MLAFLILFCLIFFVNLNMAQLSKKNNSPRKNGLIKKEKLLISDFSFEESREKLKDLKSNLSDAVIEERRSYL